MSAKLPTSPTEGQVRRALHLRTFPAFSGLAPDALAVLARPSTPRHYRAGEALLEPGGPSGILHFILEGEVDVLEGGEVVRTMGPREAVGGLAVLDPDAAEVHARARTDADTLALDRRDLEAVFEDHPEIRGAVTRAVARTLRNVLERRGVAPRLSAPAAPSSGSDPDDLVEAIRAMVNAFGFCEVTVAAAADLGRDARPKTLDPGASVWAVGDEAPDLAVVFSGRLGTIDGAFEPTEYGPGEVVGLLESLAGSRRWYGLEAKAPSVILRLTVDALLDVADEHPELATGLLAALARTAAQRFRREHGE